MENNSLNNRGVIFGPVTAGKDNKVNNNPNNKKWLLFLIAVIIITGMIIGIIKAENIGDVLKFMR